MRCHVMADIPAWHDVDVALVSDIQQEISEPRAGHVHAHRFAIREVAREGIKSISPVHISCRL